MGKDVSLPYAWGIVANHHLSYGPSSEAAFLR